jgi:hypothetical protein
MREGDMGICGYDRDIELRASKTPTMIGGFIQQLIGLRGSRPMAALSAKAVQRLIDG